MEDVVWVGASRASGIDLTNPDALESLGRCDVIINLAGRVGVRDSWGDPSNYLRTNLLSTVSVMDHARRHGARVIHLSSYLYGTPSYQPIDEEHPVGGHNPYAASKLESEALCREYSEGYSIPTTILRPFNLFGPGQSNLFLVPLVIAQALANGPVRVHSLTPRRDYLWIDDLVAAIVLVVRRQLDGLAIFNVGSGRSYSTKEVIDAVFLETGPTAIECEHTPRANELSECICNYTRFRLNYGWEPQVSLREGIARLVKEARSKM